MCQAQAGVSGASGVASCPKLQQVTPQEPGEHGPRGCHAAAPREPWVLNFRRFEFYLGLPSRGSVGEALSEINALSSESTVPKCHLSGGIWICKTFLSSGQLFISPEQEDIPRSEFSEPCPALSSVPTPADPGGNCLRSHSCEPFIREKARGTRTAAGGASSPAPGSPSKSASCTDLPNSQIALTFHLAN